MTTERNSFTIELLDDPVTSIHDLVALRIRWAAEQGRALSEGDSFESDLADWVAREAHSRRFWLAWVDGAPVGMVNLLMFRRMPTVGRPAGGWGYLCNMYVDEAHRNDGLGSALAQALLDFADEQGLERVVLSPTERSRPFYASLGFGAADNLLLRPHGRGR